MSKKERLLRIAALILLLRDEFEDAEINPEWCNVANAYLEALAIDDEVNEQFSDLFIAVNNMVKEVAEPWKLTGELFKILQKDLKAVSVSHDINAVTQGLKLKFDVKMVKLLDSKIRLVK